MSANPETVPSATIMFVDDEANILSSLQRLFRPAGYRILTAESGNKALEVFAHEHIDLVISDMRMPGMDGAEFLEQVTKSWPDTIRILLTGYADISSTINAINKGSIYRYIPKPWEDTDILLCVKQALEKKDLEREKKRLESKVLQQNEQLKELNTSLERKVASRTQEIQQTADMLDLAYQQLKQAYDTTISVFSHLIGLREGTETGHTRRVAEHAQAIATKLGLSEGDVQDIHYSALLHDIGKIGLPDNVLNKSYIDLSENERAGFEKHPATGQAILLSLDTLHKASEYIRSHHERFDGKGYPDKLSGERIPLGARILAVASDYDALQAGKLLHGKMSAQEACSFLIANRNQRYDAKIVDTFLHVIDTTDNADISELRLSSDDLHEGMVLSRDLVSKGGLMLLSKGRTLNAVVIHKVIAFEKEEGHRHTIYIQSA
ncbi:MAG: response regulator [Gammaproteobacteria bacterium]|nr:response regulator [Gammaproteobacteria bacterium]